MPYAEKKDYRKSHRERFAAQYDADPKFREAEAARKASWYQQNREKVIAKVLARRAEIKNAK
jgi:hypothetical protein